MALGKSCIRCAKPLQADSQAELCKECTPDGRSAETSEQNKPSQSHSTILPPSLAPIDATISFLNDPVKHTDAAAAGHFVTGKATTDDEDAIKIGNESIKLNGYKMLRELGRGGCGIVFEALQLKTKRIVAIKIMLSNALENRLRFDRETRALGRLKDPRVIEVYEAGVCNVGDYYCMERMEGGSLADVLKAEGSLEPSKAAELVESITRGMATVHAAGLFHRDLKPGNILLDSERKPKIADFGLAKAYEAVADETTAANISVTNQLLGTPHFMAPEQAARQNANVDARTDIYCLGGILYQCLCGKVPFTGKTRDRLLDQVIYDRPVDPSSHQAGIPKDLEAICLKCLEKHPDARYQSALELADDLAAWQRGDETIARPATRFQRAGRWLKRKRKAASIAMLVLAVAATINLAGMWLKGKPEVAPNEDPEAELKKIIKEIENGELVTLLGESGLPRYYPKDNNPVVFQESRYADNSCTINSTTETLFELLREKVLPAQFRFQADVRHEFAAANSGGRAGIFFGKFTYTDETNRKLIYFHRHAFSDHVRQDFGDIQNHILLNPSCIRINPGKLSETGYAPVALIPISNPPIVAPRTWRHLDITVQKTGLKITDIDNNSKITPKSEFGHSELFSFLLNASDQTTPDQGLQNRSGETILSGSLGLYATEGVANFKNVTIQKIRDK